MSLLHHSEVDSEVVRHCLARFQTSDFLVFDLIVRTILGMEGFKYGATSVDAVYHWLTQGTRMGSKWILLVDIRGNTAFQKSHIRFAVNLHLSKLLLRRIFRGTAAVENVCPDTVKHVIEYRKLLDCCIVLYDESSTCQHTHKDIMLYADMLQPSTANRILYIDGKCMSRCMYILSDVASHEVMGRQAGMHSRNTYKICL